MARADHAVGLKDVETHAVAVCHHAEHGIVGMEEVAEGVVHIGDIFAPLLREVLGADGRVDGHHDQAEQLPPEEGGDASAFQSQHSK